MITLQDFQKKQIVFVFFNDGEKMNIANDNLVVRNKDGSIKFQCSCYRLFLIFAVGYFSITSAVLQRAQKFGFYIACMSGGFRLQGIMGANREGNTLLKTKQYAYDGIGIGLHIVKNKITNQRSLLREVRHKSEAVREAIDLLGKYLVNLNETLTLGEIMAYEGLAAKCYFKNHFNTILWKGRQPRLKRDCWNSALDIGYSLLFTFLDCIVQCYGFDTYVGVLHRQFYMRKSLICDLVEPFRVLIDRQVKKGINLKQIQEEDFLLINHQWTLKYEKMPHYVKLFMTPLLEHRDEIFKYIHQFYIAFMKGAPSEKFPIFLLEEENGNHQL